MGQTAMKLSDVLRRDLSRDPEIKAVTADSRKAGEGVLFCALPGTKFDGRDFIPEALRKGCAAVLAPYDTTKFDTKPEDNVIQVQDVKRAYALAAKAFYQHQPATCVAITGTNGKTSVATFCRQLWAQLGRKSASMGTLGVISQSGSNETVLTGPGLTTPDACDVARLLAELSQDGVTHLALEASSHGIDQRRLDGVSLKAAAFTNFTQDHLDYHHTMAAYKNAKLRLFEQLLPRARACVLNADSDAYNEFAAASILAGQEVVSVGERGQHLCLTDRRLDAGGADLKSYVSRRFPRRQIALGRFVSSLQCLGCGGTIIGDR